MSEIVSIVYKKHFKIKNNNGENPIRFWFLREQVYLQLSSKLRILLMMMLTSLFSVHVDTLQNRSRADGSLNNMSEKLWENAWNMKLEVKCWEREKCVPDFLQMFSDQIMYGVEKL
jgi:hypothetical protein